MADFHKLRAKAERIRKASGSISDPQDLKIVSEYLKELEQRAARQEAAASKSKD